MKKITCSVERTSTLWRKEEHEHVNTVVETPRRRGLPVEIAEKVKNQIELDP